MEFRGETKDALENMVRLRVKESVGIDYLMKLGIGNEVKCKYTYQLFKRRFITQEMQNSIGTPDFKFGDFVTFENRIDKNLIFSITNGLDERKPYYAYWRQYPLEKNDTGRGLFVGYRTLRNGWVHEIEGSSNQFKPDMYLKVALVCKNANTGPRRVAIQGMRKQ